MFKVKDKITNMIFEVYSVERGNVGSTWFLIYLNYTWLWVIADDYEPVVESGDNNA